MGAGTCRKLLNFRHVNRHSEDPNIIGSESHEKNGYGTKSNVYTQTGPFSVSVNEKGFAESEGSAGWGYNAQIDFDASRSNQIYGASETVQPSALRALACIKF